MSSMGEVESVASSAISSVSTRNQVDKCKDVLSKALNLKKLVSTTIKIDKFNFLVAK